MSNNRVTRQRRWALRMTFLTTALALVIGSILMYAVQLSSINIVQGRLGTYESWLSAFRFAFIVCVAWFWSPIVRYLHSSNRIYEIRIRDLLALRWRVIAWMLTLEVFIGQNLIGRLIAALSGMA